MRIEVRIGAAVRVQRIDKPPEQPEQVDIGDRIAIDGPLAAAKALFGEHEDLAPAIVAGAAGRVDRRGDKRHPRDDSGFAFDIAVLRQQPGLRVTPRQIPEGRRDLGQRPAVDHQGRHLAFGIDPEIAGFAVGVLMQRDVVQLERGADLVERDMRRHRAGAGRKIERQHSRT